MFIGPIDLQWRGHASFLVKSSLVIYIDPYKLKSFERADLILITHSHPDHCSIEDLNKIIKEDTEIVIPADCLSKIGKLNKEIRFHVLEPGQEIVVKNATVKAVPAYNINKNFHGKSEYWNGYILGVDGKRIYHAGDTDLIPEMSNLENIDVALLPIGGTYTMSAEEAARAAILIRPKVTIPMHYNTLVGSREDALRFMEACENEGVSCKLIDKQ